jgi:hypothetical protein
MRRPTSLSARSERGEAGNRVRRALVLAAVALLSWAAWTIVGGVAGLLYGLASGTALIGLLLLALRRQRSTRDAHVESDESTDAPSETAGSTTTARPLPGIRMSRFVRELEKENRLLREELAQRLEALRSANELRAHNQSVYEEALDRLERNLRHHSRERALLEAELETLLRRRSATTADTVGAVASRALTT